MMAMETTAKDVLGAAATVTVTAVGESVNTLRMERKIVEANMAMMPRTAPLADIIEGAVVTARVSLKEETLDPKAEGRGNVHIVEGIGIAVANRHIMKESLSKGTKSFTDLHPL